MSVAPDAPDDAAVPPLPPAGEGGGEGKRGSTPARTAASPLIHTFAIVAFAFLLSRAIIFASKGDDYAEAAATAAKATRDTINVYR